jgi:hypothetical protein
MIELPPDLAPWSALLGLFPPELAASLGAWVPELDRLIGPLRAARPLAHGEPDGFSGIARRGSVERLLLSEWLLADEVPDEFVRRAAMNELAYLEIGRRAPVRARRSVVLFEAGPTQIGSPRIVHLAALIVLARRAERQGARFSWGMLHEPEGALLDGVTRESMLRLLAARTARAAGAQAISAWALRADKEAWEDLWIIGRGALPDDTGRRARPRFRPMFLDVNDVLEPGRREVTAMALTHGAPPREVSLPLPPPRASARLLRDPFAATMATPRAAQKGLAPASNLLFAPNATKLFTRGASGEIISYPIPNSPRAPAGRPKRYRAAANGVVTAVGWHARGLTMLTITEQELILESTSTNAPSALRGSIPRPEDLALSTSSKEDPLRPLLFRPYGPRLVAVALDAAGTLFEISNDFDPPVTRIATGVTAVAPLGQHVAFIGSGGDASDRLSGITPIRRGIQTIPPTAIPTLVGGYHLVKLGSDRAAGSIEALSGDGSFQACFGYAESAPPSRGLIAIQQYGEEWTIHGASSPPPLLHPPKDTRVVGVWQASEDADPMLVLLDEDRRAISLYGLHSARELPRASDEITQVTLSTARPYLAYATVSGEVVVLSLLEAETPLARFVPEGE